MRVPNTRHPTRAMRKMATKSPREALFQVRDAKTDAFSPAVRSWRRWARSRHPPTPQPAHE